MKTKGFNRYKFEQSVRLKELEIAQIELNISVLQMFRRVNLVKLLEMQREIEMKQLEIAELFLLMDEVDEDEV